MPGRLILARHAQSVLDAEKRYSGTQDPELSEHGIREADALAFTLKISTGLVFDYVFTSGLCAAKRTAEVAMRKVGYQHGIELVKCLDERDYGVMTDLTYDEALERFGRGRVEQIAHGGYTKDEPLAASWSAP